MSPRLAFALEAAVRAGRATLAHFQTGVEIERKADATPVTVADREAERIIRAEIARSFPNEAILGEEEGASGEGSARWIIDPIDGTKSFVCGVPLYATLLSFERDGVPEIGVCYLPALDEIVYAERGQGAFLNGRPCRVSTTSSLDGAALSCGGHGSLDHYGYMSAFLKIAKRAMATRTWSDAYGHALVAIGRVDAMVDPIVNHWDISAMSLIVEEAGGRFSDLSGRPGLHAQALSSNGLLHDALVEALNP